MSSATVRSGFDTWVGSGKPSAPHPKDKYLTLDASGGAAKALFYFKVPAPRGATITSATLRVFTRGASSGSRTLTAKRITQTWKVSSTNWNNAPSTTTTSAATATIGTVTGGYAIDFNVTTMVQSITNGSNNFGFEVTTNTATPHLLYGMDSGGNYKPVLLVEWEDAPAAPTTLTPADGVVSVTKPTLQFDYTDVSGNTSLAAVRVQIDPAADEVSPDFDSGAFPTTSPELPLTATAFPGLAAGVPTQWRVQVQDGAGLWSEWSDWVTMTYASQTGPTITSPTGSVVYETTPPVVWTASGQTAFQVLVYSAADPSRAVMDSGKKTSTDLSYPIVGPTFTTQSLLKDGQTYTVEVRTWDANADRVATPGAPLYRSATTTFTVAVDATVGSVSSITATTDETPVVTIEWTRSTAPDSWTIYEDGLPIAADLTPGETVVSGSTYRYEHSGARPNVEHTYAVRAVVNGRMSADGVTSPATPRPVGIWIVDPDDGTTVTLWGDDEGSWDAADDATVYTPVNSTEVVRIVSGLHGLSGNLTGYLAEGFGQTFAEQEAAIYALKSRPVARLRLVLADESFEVLIGNVRVSPRPITRAGQVVKSVSLDFWQVGALPFSTNI